MRQLILLLLMGVITIVPSGSRMVASAQDHEEPRQTQATRKPSARIDEAIGVMTKGQLCNLTMNYGQISDTRLEDPGNRPTDDFFNFRYPKSKPYGSMCDDFSLIFAVEKNTKNGDNGNVIDGYTNNGNEDWIAKDGSLGKTHYDGRAGYPMLLYVDGSTPYLAHSDLPQTWPVNEAGEPFWPGYFRRDPSSGTVYQGEFASDRDVYAVFTDANNQQGHPLGLEVEMMAYCYGRPYAEDFQFYEFFIHNTTAATIEQAWVGIYLDPDCGDYSQEVLITPEGHGLRSRYPVIMQRDFDGDIGAATVPNPVGRLEDMDFGIIILETPRNLGVTDFHYFTDPGPTFDHELWPIISSKPDDPDIAAIKAEFFHGADPRLDDLSGITAKDWVFIVTSGPFDLAPGQVVKYTIAVVVGDTDADFLNNCEMAIQMFEKGFVGPAAPPGPRLSAVPGDRKVTLYWDDSPETRPDPLTGEIDFEGYKLYRSEDGGATWGTPVTDARGSVVGYVPLAQFDLKNDIEGIDPLNSSTYLGNNSGLRYCYVDSPVVNGIEYCYTVTAYDRGDPAARIPSFETAKGVGSAERHFVRVTPRPEPLAFLPGRPSPLRRVSGKGRGTIEIELVDENAYRSYQESAASSSAPLFKLVAHGFPATTFSLFDSARGNYLLAGPLPMNQAVMPVLGEVGLRITVTSEPKIGGIQSIVDEAGNDVWGAGKSDQTLSWYVTASELTAGSLDARSNSYEIHFGTDSSMAYSKGRSPVALMKVPFRVWRIYPDTLQVACEYDDRNQNRQFESGETIYLVNVPYPAAEPTEGEPLQVNFPEDFPLQLMFQKVPASSELPEGGHLPVPGQKVVINCHSGFSDGSGFSATSAAAKGDVFVFSVQPGSVDHALVAELLREVRVVPNPYVVTSLFDPKENVHSLKFLYLPAECTITIYSLSGVKIKELHHDDGTGMENWDLTNEFGQDIAFGVYVYVVTTPSGAKRIGKLAIIK
ncbi:MAG: hypothetical protein ACUVWA_11435 [Candidatus Oleimicrobiaceae bacterium]